MYSKPPQMVPPKLADPAEWWLAFGHPSAGTERMITRNYARLTHSNLLFWCSLLKLLIKTSILSIEIRYFRIYY